MLLSSPGRMSMLQNLRMMPQRKLVCHHNSETTNQGQGEAARHGDIGRGGSPPPVTSTELMESLTWNSEGRGRPHPFISSAKPTRVLRKAPVPQPNHPYTENIGTPFSLGTSRFDSEEPDS